MVGPGVFRGDQHENEIDRQAVQSLEIDRALEPCENAENPVALGELAMGNGDAVADPGRAQPLALQDRIENLARRQARHDRRPFAHFLQGLFLAVDPQRRDHRVRPKNVEIRVSLP